MSQTKEELASRNYKDSIKDLLRLFRVASRGETIAHYWVNRTRGQFVLEYGESALRNVRFRDRIPFSEHFLDEYRDLQVPVVLKVDKDLSRDALSHYYDEMMISDVLIVPVRNQEQTIALVVLDSEAALFIDRLQPSIDSFTRANVNVLQTFLHFTDLLRTEPEWSIYEEQLEKAQPGGLPIQQIQLAMEQIQGLLHQGGVGFVTRGCEDWVLVMATSRSIGGPLIGTRVADGSLASQALQSGSPVYAVHFNQAPFRLSPNEDAPEGATLAVPILMDGHRQGVIIAYDRNPLMFKESTKHKIINWVRLANLSIQARLEPPFSMDRPLFSESNLAYSTEIWERCIKAALESKQEREEAQGTSEAREKAQPRQTIFGMVTLANVPDLRARLRVDELLSVQRAIVKLLHPGSMQLPGFIGFQADYVYAFVMQQRDAQTFKQWHDQVRNLFSGTITVLGGQKVQLQLKIAHTTLRPDEKNWIQVVDRTKKALSQSVKDPYLDTVPC